MTDPLPAMFLNGQIVPAKECPGSGADLLLKFAKGPYTAARISGGEVQCLNRHLARLAEAVTKLHSSGRAKFGIMSSIKSVPNSLQGKHVALKIAIYMLVLTVYDLPCMQCMISAYRCGK